MFSNKESGLSLIELSVGIGLLAIVFYFFSQVIEYNRNIEKTSSTLQNVDNADTIIGLHLHKKMQIATANVLSTSNGYSKDLLVQTDSMNGLVDNLYSSSCVSSEWRADLSIACPIDDATKCPCLKLLDCQDGQMPQIKITDSSKEYIFPSQPTSFWPGAASCYQSLGGNSIGQYIDYIIVKDGNKDGSNSPRKVKVKSTFKLQLKKDNANYIRR